MTGPAAARAPWLRQLALTLLWSVAVYLAARINIAVPGTHSVRTDVSEAVLLACAVFLPRAWLTLLPCLAQTLAAAATDPLTTSLQTTLVMHVVAVPIAWYAYRALLRGQAAQLRLGLAWAGFVLGYYLALLLPILLVTNAVFRGLDVQRALDAYPRLLRAWVYEISFTTAISALVVVVRDELTRRRRAEQRLREALAAQRAMVDAAPVAIVGVTADGLVSSWNPAAERLFGPAAATAIGGPAPVLAADGTPVVEEVLAGAALARTEGEVRHPDGSRLPIAMSGAPIHDADGGRAGAVLLVEDLREHRSLRAAVQRSASMSALGQLVGGVAHELRNPLFGITATLDAFGPALVGQPKLELMDRTLRGQVEQIKTLMLDLLAYGRAGLGERATVGLELPLGQALRDCAAQAAAAGVTIDVALAPALPPVSGNASQLVQALRNLIQNAIAFSARGGVVRIEGRLEAAADDGTPACIVRLDVLDRGVGFTAADQPHVFEPFFSRRHGGTGLGLAIVQHVVEQHGGTVHATNRDGGGAAMTVRLPAAT